MNLGEYINIGERIDMNVDNSLYRTIVEDIPRDNIFLVAQITRNSRPVYVPLGTELQIYYYRPDAMYGFWAALRQRRTDRNLTLLVMEALSAPERNQRRDSYRLPNSRAVTVWNFSETIGGELDTYKFSGLTADISETGLRMLAQEVLPKDAIVHCDIELPDQVVGTKAEVLRVIQPETRDQPYQLGFRFVDSTDRFRRTMMKFILQEQVTAKRRL